MKHFATTAASKLIDDAMQDDDTPSMLEDYYPASQDERILCLTEEREDFERLSEKLLTEDVIEDRRDYDDLVKFLVENYDLQEVAA